MTDKTSGPSSRWIWFSSFSCSAATELATVPIDLTKVRLQVQKTTGGGPQYKGMMDAMVQMCKTEGPMSLYQGSSPAVIRQCCYTSIAMLLFPHIKSAISDDAEPGFLTRLIAGGTAGAAGIAVMNPTEILKTQMQTSVGGTSMGSVARRVYRVDGIAGFWAGVGPNVMRCFLVNAAELGTYDQAKHEVQRRGWFAEVPMLQHVTASGIAGLASSLVSTPADVVKTRLMNQAGGSHAYSGVIDAFVGIPRHEGFSALYKGFGAILTRKIVWCTVFFVSYEQVLKREPAFVSGLD